VKKKKSMRREREGCEEREKSVRREKEEHEERKRRA
jgi:hypothetical protein